MSFREEAWSPDLHEVPDPGAGEGVPLQPLPDAAEKDRDCTCSLPYGATDQDLVPEQAYEMEEGEQVQVGRRRRIRRFSTGVTVTPAQ